MDAKETISNGDDESRGSSRFSEEKALFVLKSAVFWSKPWTKARPEGHFFTLRNEVWSKHSYSDFALEIIAR